MSIPNLSAAFDFTAIQLEKDRIRNNKEEKRFEYLCDRLEQGEFKAVLDALIDCLELYPWHSQQDKEEMGYELLEDLQEPIYKAIQARAYDQIRKERARA